MRVAGKGIGVDLGEGQVAFRPPMERGPTTAALEARGLVKRYGEREALRGVELRRRRRGAGGGDRAERGREDDAALDPGRDLQARRRRGRACRSGEVGWVPQQAALYRRLTVEENLLLFARLEKHEDPRASVEEMLELTGLGERRGEIVARLSGGNQQRINIAIGLLSRPVGAAARRAQRRPRPAPAGAALGVRLRRSPGGGTTVIFSTHDIQEAERYGRRLLVLADGEALFDGSAEELREAVRSEAPEAAEPRLRDRLRRLPPPPGALSACAGCCSRTCRSCAARRCRRCCWSPTRC